MAQSYMQQMQDSSHLSGQNSAYVDALYEAYLADPNSIPAEWQQYFKELPIVKNQRQEVSHAAIVDQFAALAKQQGARTVIAGSADMLHEKQQTHVTQMINAYRLHGHHHADLDPLNLTKRRHVPDLDLEHYGFSQKDLNIKFSTESALTGNGASLQDIHSALQRTYCDTLGVEFMHITDNDEIAWLQQQLESVRSHPQFTNQQKHKILQDLTAADGLERYLGNKYVGQKRFSLEGGDSLVPMFHEMIDRAAGHGVKELVIGMAHRGRLNVLVNVMGKAPAELFAEFEGKHIGDTSGDVKYHMGYSSDVQTAHGTVHLALAFNPSHLEIINPVVQGSVRSRMRRRGDIDEKCQVIPVVVHGDAAFAGQGVVMETFNFSQARGYATGGTVHVVINNQIGFTTSNPLDARSTLYCTDVAKMVQAPIFHVNADDPEVAVFAMQLAVDYRMKFKKDVVIDLVCYRRHGHNEADEPSVTQPVMYQTIKKLATPRQMYAERLVAEGVITSEQAEKFAANYRDQLDKGQPVVETVTGQHEDKFLVNWQKYLNKEWTEPAETKITVKQAKQLGEAIVKIPDGFTLHPVVKRLIAERAKMTAGEQPINWGYAESLAYASLVTEGYPVRLSGQDCGRGTFAHRHAVLHDFKTAECYQPLQHINDQQSPFLVIDSVLSEEAVLGFEYGFAASEPNVLVIWEAQFGDFVNGAQVVIDQFISSGDQKWGRLCGLVMFLPHGFEGQGPEHSSARLERFLQLCAQHNMQVCVPSTPAQCFHMLRRQMLRPFRKPLIVMTPKSLLRHKLAVSSSEDLTKGKFHNVIGEIDELDPKKVRKVVLCSGKVYYDLLEQRRKNKQTDVAIIRIEQLYPFPEQELAELLKSYAHVTDVVWCQEEPQNQGAWYSSQHHMRASLQGKQQLNYVGRDYFAAPAVGYYPLHLEQQQKLVSEALA